MFYANTSTCKNDLCDSVHLNGITSCFGTVSLPLSETKLNGSDTNEVGASQLAVA